MRSPSRFLAARTGLYSAARTPLSRAKWNIVVAVWFAVVLALFLKLRILDSETITFLMRYFTVR